MELTDNNAYVSKEVGSAKTQIDTLGAKILQVTASKYGLQKTLDNIYVR